MFCFPKKERLCAHRRIESLFSKGEAFLCYPFSVRFVKHSQGKGNISTLIVCSKRYQRKAVNRNYIKRRIREAYRLNNHSLKIFLSNRNMDLDISLSYISKDLLDFHNIEFKLKEVLALLQKEIGQ